MSGDEPRPLPADGGAAAVPFPSNQEHLAAELARADQLLRAQTERWRATLAASKPAEHWGMVLVSEAEIDAYLEAPFQPPGAALPAGIEERAAPYARAAAEMARRIAVREAATPRGAGLRLRRLAEAFALAPVERDVVVLCLLIERDVRLRRLVGYLQDDATRRRPSVDLLEQVLRPVAPPGELQLRFAAGPLTLGPHPAAPLLALDGDDVLAERGVRLDDRVAAFLLGSNAFDRGLDGVVERAAEPADPPAEALAGLDPASLAAQLDEDGAVVLLAGPYGSGRRHAAARIAAAAGGDLLLASVPAALARPEGWGRVVDLAFREARLGADSLAWTGCERLLARDEEAPLLERLLDRARGFPGLVFLLSERPWEGAGRTGGKPFLRFDLGVPSYGERRRLWQRALAAPELLRPPVDRDTLAAELANGFQLTGGQIADAMASARGEALRRDPAAPLLTPADLYTGCRRQSGRVLHSFARRIEPRPGIRFDQLVLPPPSRRQLDDLRLRIRHRSRVASELGFERHLPLGKGLVALFSGSSGTGKTFAAELLAGEQGVDLYKVDLSAVVSKYIGETEKNLERVFVEAERSNALLFFDEADALFGKRGEVKEARDRWANLEINFLLQRIEEYPGVVVLTTNLRQNIDEAFLRRIQVLVEFPFPDEKARFEIWRRLFPAEVERPDDEALRSLAARFRLPGGGIKNVVVDAAHRAAAEAGGETPRITLAHLGIALVREHQKLGKPVTKSEFGEDLYRLFEAELA